MGTSGSTEGEEFRHLEGARPLLLRKSQLQWFERLIGIRVPPSGGPPDTGGDPQVDPEIAGGIISSICSENAPGTPSRSWEVLLGRLDRWEVTVHRW